MNPSIITNTDGARSNSPKRRPALRRLQRGISGLIVVLVAAIVAVSIFSLSIPNLADTTSRYQNVNSRKLANINLALRQFAVKYGRLPCPAGLTFTTTDPLYGVEAGSPGGPGNCVPGGGVTKVSNTVTGAVPWVTLGLSEDNSIDAYGHRIEYMVLEAATGSTVDTMPSLTGELSLYSGTPVSDGAALTGTGQNQLNACSATPADNSCNQLGIFALISRGANAFGAYTGKGIQMPLPPLAQQAQYPAEMENLNGDLKFVSQTGIAQSTFDDMILMQSSKTFIASVYNELSLPTLTKITNDRVKLAFSAILGMTLSNRNQNTTATARYGDSAQCNTLIQWWMWWISSPCAIGVAPDMNSDGTINASDAFGGSRVWQSGRLPYLDLGIPSAQTVDGWGHSLIYGINSDMVSNSGAIPNSGHGINSSGTSGRPRTMTTIGVPYITQADMAFEVRSMGADGLAGTSDDIYMQIRINPLIAYFTNASQPLP